MVATACAATAAPQPPASPHPAATTHHPGQDAVLERLQQPLAGACLPLDIKAQPQLHALLQQAAARETQLRAAGADIDWAAGFDDPPTAWCARKAVLRWGGLGSVRLAG